MKYAYVTSIFGKMHDVFAILYIQVFQRQFHFLRGRDVFIMYVQAFYILQASEQAKFCYSKKGSRGNLNLFK